MGNHDILLEVYRTTMTGRAGIRQKNVFMAAVASPNQSTNSLAAWSQTNLLLFEATLAFHQKLAILHVDNCDMVTWDRLRKR